MPASQRATAAPELTRVLPAALPDGGVIGVPAPASPFHNRSQVERGQRLWEQLGYRVKLAAGIADREHYLAGSAESRARDLMACFTDPEVDVVLCMQGGYGSNQLIPLLDYAAIRANPKPLVGYSDITSLHVAVRQRAGLVTFYGPGLLSMSAPTATSFTQQRLLSVLRDGGCGPVPADPDDGYLRTLSGGQVTGTLVGGDLWELRETLGTPWEIQTAGRILFFEDVDVPPWQIDGMLSQLTHAGKLQQVLGVVVGQMAGCEWSRERAWTANTKSLEDVLEYYLGPLGVPVLYGLPLGHGTHLATIPLGVTATLDADAQKLTIDEPGVVSTAKE
ncbi:MAG: S66 peptidase family protein [Nocardioidaceae bacterium]